MSPNRTSPAAVILTADDWIQIGLERGFSTEALFQALEESKRSKSQETFSLASGDLATARRYWLQDWYRKLGFNITVPLPTISDEEFNRRKALGQALFYRPAASDLPAAQTAQAGVSYEALMKALGQGEHWTVADKNDRNKVVWEPAKQGYWYWAEAAESCPRLGTSWNNLTKKEKLNLLSLEEYVIVWWATRAETNTLLDVHTWSWLRTRFGSSALVAFEYHGRVSVSGWRESGLADSYDGGGGRIAEVVKM